MWFLNRVDADGRKKKPSPTRDETDDVRGGKGRIESVVAGEEVQEAGPNCGAVTELDALDA